MRLRMFWATALKDGLGYPSSSLPYMPHAVPWLCSHSLRHDRPTASRARGRSALFWNTYRLASSPRPRPSRVMPPLTVV